MAKSKQQKQEEALARKRQNYNVHLERYMKRQPGGELYKETINYQGPTVATQLAHQANLNWIRYLLEAKLDPHGNPLNPVEEEHLTYFMVRYGPKGVARPKTKGPVKFKSVIVGS